MPGTALTCIRAFLRYAFFMSSSVASRDTPKISYNVFAPKTDSICIDVCIDVRIDVSIDDKTAEGDATTWYCSYRGQRQPKRVPCVLAAWPLTRSALTELVRNVVGLLHDVTRWAV